VRTKKNILITGLPGIGKTTIIKKLAEELKNLGLAGFYTAEIREGGVRQGFELVGLNGRRGLLSHVDIKSTYRVGRYGVALRSFEIFLDSLALADPKTQVVIIDEIGKMECLSPKFKAVVRDVLDSEKPVIATIALKGAGFIAEVKNRVDIKLVEMTAGNRDALPAEIAGYVREILEASGQEDRNQSSRMNG
jgi:nucleoside-triphosphatase